jgi:hypothetical protein
MDSDKQEIKYEEIKYEEITKPFTKQFNKDFKIGESFQIGIITFRKIHSSDWIFSISDKNKFLLDKEGNYRLTLGYFLQETSIKDFFVDNITEICCEFDDDIDMNKLKEELKIKYEQKIQPLLMKSLKQIVVDKFNKYDYSVSDLFFINLNVYRNNQRDLSDDIYYYFLSLGKNNFIIKEIQLKKNPDLKFTMLSCANKSPETINFCLNLIDNK